VYHTTEQVLPAVASEEHLGFLKRIGPHPERAGVRPHYMPEAATFFQRLVQMPAPVDRWVGMTRNQLLHQYGSFLGLAGIEADAVLADRVAPLMPIAERNYYSLTGMVESLTQHGRTREAWARAVTYLEAAGRLRDNSLDAERLGREHYLRGFLAFRLGDALAADRWFTESLRVHPAPQNAAHLALAQLRQVHASRPSAPGASCGRWGTKRAPGFEPMRSCLPVVGAAGDIAVSGVDRACGNMSARQGWRS
jgi:hypothetical protein